jgi:hypothetical protein
MAAMGLGIGIMWPRFAGFHLVPAPPSGSTPASTASETASPDAASPEPTVSQAVERPIKPNETDSKPAGVNPPKISLAQVISCQSKDSGRQTHCESPPIESVIEDPLRALIACDGAEDARGVLSLGFDVDFGANKLDNFVAGRSTTLASSLSKRLVHCAEKQLAKVSLEGIKHSMDAYRVFYKLEFGGRESAAVSTDTEPEKGGATPTSDEVVAASGRVTVTWEAALVRAKPREGEILARVLGGTRLTVTGHQGDWYRVKYDGKGSEGWVYKGAIGL